MRNWECLLSCIYTTYILYITTYYIGTALWLSAGSYNNKFIKMLRRMRNSTSWQTKASPCTHTHLNNIHIYILMDPYGRRSSLLHFLSPPPPRPSLNIFLFFTFSYFFLFYHPSGCLSLLSLLSKKNSLSSLLSSLFFDFLSSIFSILNLGYF